MSAISSIAAIPKTFPAKELELRLRRKLKNAAEHSRVLRGPWEPLLDSLTVVSVIIELEDLCEFELPPEIIVRRGGYEDIEDATQRILANIERLWGVHHSKGD